MKITFSWWESDKSNHTSTWDVPYCDPWVIRRFADDYFELMELRRENHELKKAAEQSDVSRERPK